MKAFSSASVLILFVLIFLQSGCTGTAADPTSPTTSGQAKVSSLSPNAITTGKPAFVLVVAGTNLTPESVVTWNGVAQPTTFVSSTELAAQVSPELTAQESVVPVAVMNRQSRQRSNALPLRVGNPPQITTTSLPAGQVGVSYSAPLSVKGGVAPFTWSTVSGALPAGLGLSSSTGTISGTATDSVNSTVGVEVTDSLNSSAKSNLAIRISPAASAPPSGTGSGSSPATPPSSSSSFYGPGLGSDGLANTTVGPYGNMVSYRFRAKNSGPLEQALIYLIPDHPGYAGGNAGTTQITLNTDDGTASHNPSSTVLASYVMANVLSLASPARYFYTVKFAVPPTLTSGQIYHMVFKSIDASPSVNFLSVDAMYEINTSGLQGPINADTTDAAVLLGEQGSKWAPRTGYVPVYQLQFQSGVTEGMGYMEGWVGAPEAMSGANAVREIFTVSGSDVKVASVAVRAARVSGSDPLVVRLENAEGSLIEEGSIPANSIPLSSVSSPSYSWVSYTFSTTYTLVPGNTYHLDFEAASTSKYQTFPIRKGSAYGFQPTTFFPDGYAEFEQNGAWSGWTQWGVTNRTDGDLQFYFSVAP
jgi:hypothetical protein